jgi:dienelactone hydrolase
MWLITLALLLAACGQAPGSSESPAAPGNGGNPPPIPNSEKARVTAIAPAPQSQDAEEPSNPERQPTEIPPPPENTPTRVIPPADVVQQTQPPEQTTEPEPSLPVEPPTPFPTLVPREEFKLKVMSFQAEDGLELQGTLYLMSDTKDRLPGVIILPMHVETRQVWDKYARLLARGGYAVLTLDPRGQGETAGAPNWQQAVLDIGQVWNEFIQHKNVDASRTAILGSSSGANLALNVMAARPELRTVVLISPLLNFNGVTTNEPLPQIGARQILVISGDLDPISGDWPESMQSLAPRQISLRSVSTTDHGTFLISNAPETLNIVQKWFDDQLSGNTQSQTRQVPYTWLLLTIISCAFGLFLVLTSMAWLHWMVRKSQEPAAHLSISKLSAGIQEVEIRGTVSEVQQPLNLPWDQNIAAVYLRIEKTNNGIWTILKEFDDATAFILDDPSGCILVEKSTNGFVLDVRGSHPTKDQVDALLDHFGIGKNDDLWKQRDKLRFTLWQLCKGDEVSIMGDVWGRLQVTPTAIYTANDNLPALATMLLHLNQRYARIRGQITDVLQPQDKDLQQRLALRRAVIEQIDPQLGRLIVFERWYYSDFCMRDNLGEVWVRPDLDQLQTFLPPRELTRDEFQNTLSDTAVDDLPPGGNYHYYIYELRSGERVTLRGHVTGETVSFIARRGSPCIRTAPLLPIETLQPGMGRVKIRGKVVEVDKPLNTPSADGKTPALALMRIDSEELNRSGKQNYPPLVRAVAFRIQDSTGSVWVNPLEPVGDSLGEGSLPAQSRLDTALRFLGEKPAEWKNRRCTLWEIHQGQTVTLSGIVANPSGASRRPDLLLMPSDRGINTRIWRPTVRQGVALALFALTGLLALCGSVAALAYTLSQLF